MREARVSAPVTVSALGRIACPYRPQRPLVLVTAVNATVTARLLGMVIVATARSWTARIVPGPSACKRPRAANHRVFHHQRRPDHRRPTHLAPARHPPA